jgi:glycosyltransferase involved in cell wall biosynthesis
LKYSILIPTRNRLGLLKLAVETVRRQDSADWEIVISDNYSDQDIFGYVQSLNEPRIRYFRTESFIPVTENWNNALANSSGDYIVMLGDDDCLLPGYFTTIDKLLQEYEQPDFVYTSALLYAYPDVMPGFPGGFLQNYGYASFLHAGKSAYWLEKSISQEAVKQSMSFKVVFGFNMQFAVVSRSMVERLKPYGAFYQSPYPDYYAMNALLLMGERILIYPKPLVTIGISPKSFGYYFFNNSEQRGVDFLKNTPSLGMATKLKDVLLPGTNMNSSWLMSMETLKQNFGTELKLTVNYQRYRLLQFVHMLGIRCVNADPTISTIKEIGSHLQGTEVLIYGPALITISFFMKFLPARWRKKFLSIIIRSLGTHPKFDPVKIEGTYRNILDVYDSYRVMEE